MRSTVDLIKELETESAQHFCCILPVAFENTSIMVRANDDDRLQMLNDAMQQGGIPIGMIVADKAEGGVLQLKARIFPEHLEHGPNEQAQEFMMKMMEGVRETLEK
jgi:hypothetical protein